MQKLGLVGGMGPQSTVPYYMGIVYGVQSAVGKPFFPPLTVESVDVYHILGLLAEGRQQEVEEYLLKAVENLAAAGADFAALTANTSHIVYENLQRRPPIPLVSIIDATCDAAVAAGYRRLGLLGTRFTMEGEFYRLPFTRAGIEIFTPDADDMAMIDERISSELEMGIVNENTRQALVDAIARMQKRHNIDAVILGCTELPLILNDAVSPVPCLDTVQIHIKALVSKILSNN